MLESSTWIKWGVPTGASVTSGKSLAEGGGGRWKRLTPGLRRTATNPCVFRLFGSATGNGYQLIAVYSVA